MSLLSRMHGAWVHEPRVKVLASHFARLMAVKDHLKQGFLASRTLAFMDWLGNAAHRVALPYNYWRPDQWTAAFRELDLAPEAWETSLRLYPWPARLLFESSLHFLAWIPAHQQLVNCRKLKPVPQVAIS